ncbi:uncharacterized protein LOC135384244 isoform X2 [Ornithodoros turicata]
MYERIKDDKDRLLACTYYCQPHNWNSCWFKETEGSKCVRFGTSYRGKCHNGICISSVKKYNELKGKPVIATRTCERGYDYLSDSYGIYGCKYYCSAVNPTIGSEPDGTNCQDPARARTGKCQRGYCVPL